MDSVLIEPVANRSHNTLIGVGRWVRSVENPNLPKQHNSNTAACPLTDLATELQEKSLDIRQGKLPLTGREKISSRVRWCFRFIRSWYWELVPEGCRGQEGSSCPFCTDACIHHSRKRGPPRQVATSSRAGQRIAESFSREERIKLNDLHRLPLTRQPTGEQAAIAQRQRPGEIEPLAQERHQRSMPSLSRQGSKLATSTSCLSVDSP